MISVDIVSVVSPHRRLVHAGTKEIAGSFVEIRLFAHCCVCFSFFFLPSTMLAFAFPTLRNKRIVSFYVIEEK